MAWSSKNWENCSRSPAEKALAQPQLCQCCLLIFRFSSQPEHQVPRLFVELKVDVNYRHDGKESTPHPCGERSTVATGTIPLPGVPRATKVNDIPRGSMSSDYKVTKRKKGANRIRNPKIQLPKCRKKVGGVPFVISIDKRYSKRCSGD